MSKNCKNIKYYVVKNEFGYYVAMTGRARYRWSSYISPAHKYTSLKLAEKRANALGGRVIDFTAEELCNISSREYDKY